MERIWKKRRQWKGQQEQEQAKQLPLPPNRKENT